MIIDYDYDWPHCCSEMYLLMSICYVCLWILVLYQINCKQSLSNCH